MKEVKLLAYAQHTVCIKGSNKRLHGCKKGSEDDLGSHLFPQPGTLNGEITKLIKACDNGMIMIDG